MIDTIKPKDKVIDEIIVILYEVRNIQRLMGEFGININSDTWSATDITDSKTPKNNEDIFSWNRKDFEQTNFQKGDSFFIGGNITTGYEHQFKNRWIIAPKKLAEVQGEIVKEYLESIIDDKECKYIDLSFYDPYGLIDDCGWEHYMCIKATVNCDITTNNKTKKLLEKILKESDRTIETSGSPIYKNPKDKEWEEIGLKPKGDFAYMVEFFSFSLVIKENYDAVYGDANSEYIEDAYALIQEVEQRAEKLRNKYSDKGVKVTVNGFNDGCEGGLAVYVWIPYQ